MTPDQRDRRRRAKREMTMTYIRPSVSTTDFRNLIERCREAMAMPVDRTSQRSMRPMCREMENLFHQGLGHERQPRTRRYDCTEQVCLHRYQEEPWREIRMAELGKNMADLLDRARFNYKWKKGEDPLRSLNLSRMYSVRRPHIATLIRALSKQIDQAARITIRARGGS